ncbi:hypothetical protein TrLO_g2042 [Triparma laevis f. longispina]|uniref:Uncharacterized protein n=1 Tax=Triparma laevis f. longispina TaxID=1714387 RepID=A0A9W7FBT7_9STRA|nr:hypothetical protein TrLO_g2042 [Triparma laevis f. longispina]
MSTPLSLIIGGNRGIGLALVKKSLSAGYVTYATTRSPSPELNATGANIIEGIDVSNPDSFDTLISSLPKLKFDIIIHNAGIALWSSDAKKAGELDSGDFENFTKEFQVNSLGPLRALNSLVKSEHLSSGSKFGTLTSRMGSITDGSGKYLGYRGSKTWLNMSMNMSSKDLLPSGISIGILHPGMIDTDMTSGFGAEVKPEESAEGLWKTMVERLNEDTSGTFWHGMTGEVLPW